MSENLLPSPPRLLIVQNGLTPVPAGDYSLPPVLLDRDPVPEIRTRLAEYTRVFDGTPWKPDELSNSGWLCLIGVPWLLQQLKNQGQGQGHNRDTEGNPGPDGVGPAKPAL